MLTWRFDCGHRYRHPPPGNLVGPPATVSACRRCHYFRAGNTTRPHGGSDVGGTATASARRRPGRICRAGATAPPRTTGALLPHARVPAGRRRHVQETLLAAWVGLAGFEGRSSVRTWLYRIATNRCLNVLRANRAGRSRHAAARGTAPEPSRLGEVLWLQPYPDALLEGLPDSARSEPRYESREAISLAFVTAVQLLPPNQRAVLLLRDVLGYRAKETAELLGLTEDAVTSALKRARATMDSAGPAASRARTSRRSGPCSSASLKLHLAGRRRAGRLDDRRRVGADAATATRIQRSGGGARLLHGDGAAPSDREDLLPVGPMVSRVGRLPPRPGFGNCTSWTSS